MEWTKSQRQLIDLSQQPIKRFELVIVNLHNHYTMLDPTLKFMAAQPRASAWTPKNIILEAPRPWDCVMGLVNICGRNGHYGSGYVDTIWRTFKTISSDCKQINLWLQDVRGMKPQERELLVCLFDWVADQLGIKIRVVMLLGSVGVYDVHKRKRFRTIVPSGFLNSRAKQINFSDDGEAHISETQDIEEPLRKLA